MADSRFMRLPEAIGPACRVTKSFVIVERDEHGSIRVPAEAARMLRGLPGVTLSVVCVMGPTRGGKSSLCNLMVCSFAAGQASSPSVELVCPKDLVRVFFASNSGDSVTKGIHACIIYTSDTSAVMVLDLEGTGEQEANIDAQLAVIACCLSSVAILNRAGAAQQADILTNLAMLTGPCDAVASLAAAAGDGGAGGGAAAAAAAAAGGGAAAPGRKAPMGMFMVLLRDYILTSTDDQVSSKVFDMEDDARFAARNDKRKRIAAAFDKCCAMTLPPPDKSLEVSGQDFDAAMHDNLMPVLREQLAAPTRQVGSDRALHSRRLVPILEILCAAVNDESIARLLPADIEAAVLRSQVAEGASEVRDAASRRTDQVRLWAMQRGGVPTARLATALADIRERAAQDTRVAGCGLQRVVDGIVEACTPDLDRLEETARACNTALMGSVGRRCVSLVGAATRDRMAASISLAEQRTAAVAAVGRARSKADIDAVAVPEVADGAAAGREALEHVVGQARAGALEVDADDAFGAPDLDGRHELDEVAEMRRAEGEVVAGMDLVACFARIGEAAPTDMPTAHAMEVAGADAAEAEHRALVEALDQVKERARQARADAIRRGVDACTARARSAAAAKLAEVERGAALPLEHMADWRADQLEAATGAGREATGDWAADAEADLREAETGAAGLLDAAMATNRARLDGLLADAAAQLIREATASAKRVVDEALEARSAALRPAIANAPNPGAVDTAACNFTAGMASVTPESLTGRVPGLVAEAWESSSMSAIKACRDMGTSLSTAQRGEVVSRVTDEMTARIPEVKSRLQAEASSAANARRLAVTPPQVVHHHHVHKKDGRLLHW